MTPPAPSTPVRTVLFDADGVVQATAAGWQDELVGLLGERADAEGQQFLAEIRRAEAPTMDGSSDVAEVMQGVLDRFGLTSDVQDMLELWDRIEPDQGMLDAVRELRAGGLQCCLATNQQSRRARFMRDRLGYDAVFDRQFYSSELGTAKPGTAYFEAIVAQLGVEASSVLFVDDLAANVAGATAAGLHASLFPRDGGRPALRAILAEHGIGLDAAA